MELQINPVDPKIMHVDLNSCFAMIEQQAHPSYRGKPVCVAANVSPRGVILSPSYEAKRLGIRVGWRVEEARAITKDAIILAPDPKKYFFVHQKFRAIFKDYSPLVVPKSIDEAIIDFTGLELRGRALTDIGQEIKRRMKDEIGDWITCNIGIGPNRFLAKLAAGLHKPDGMDVITHETVRAVYSQVSLLDLCGINVRYQARLASAGIFTPVEFLDADLNKLRRQVFRSIVGYYWYARLRGWEVDNVEFGRKSYGQSYALYRFTADSNELAKLLMKLCEKMGRRLRSARLYAQGIHVSCRFFDQTSWHHGEKVYDCLYSTRELYRRAFLILEKRPKNRKVTHLEVSCFGLVDTTLAPRELVDVGREKERRLADALDTLNDRYGEYMVKAATMLNTDDVIVERVAFGAVKELILP